MYFGPFLTFKIFVFISVGIMRGQGMIRVVVIVIVVVDEFVIVLVVAVLVTRIEYIPRSSVNLASYIKNIQRHIFLNS